MRQFMAIMFIMLGILVYGRLFFDDGAAARRATEIEERHAIVPQPRADEVTLLDDVARPNEVELAFTAGDGEAFKAYIDKQKASVFLESTLAYIDGRRRDNRQATDRRIDLAFEGAFADQAQAIEDYADWFYGVFTSLSLLSQGTLSMFGELLSFDAEKIRSAPLKAVEEEMRAKYLEKVLKPHLRDPWIVEGVESALAESRREYLATLENIDTRIVEFISREARYVVKVSAEDQPKLKLDWAAESWRAPMERGNDAMMHGVAGIAITTGGVLLGESVLAGFSSLFGSILAEATVGMELVVEGAVLGSVEPVIGTAIGALAGFGVHGILSLFREKMERESFVKDTKDGLTVSIERWKGLVKPKAGVYVDRWYADLQKLVATPDLEAKLGT